MSTTEKSVSELSKHAESYSMDFCEGGREHMSVPTSDGAVYSFDAVYADIVPAQRIVHTYDMHRDDARISVSVTTIEFEAVGDMTRLTLTEQGVFLDGLDTPAEREHGTNAMLDALGTYVLRSRTDVKAAPAHVTCAGSRSTSSAAGC